ncbi:FRG domain-containing protein [Clostridium novyi]|uniref:FRG domain-containing protein n=1 Tax=Clostridium novyi TaxID=1542 RepID=UPI0004D9E825|nr:FRG domain-containing protein [Clostridium novyi]KEH89605.1 hypothetical protein Z964_11740 [Clostridium novyi A str. GD211209]
MGKVYVAKNLSEYISIVNELSREIKQVNPKYEVWFRGQENCNYRLTPKGLRNIKEKNVCQYMREGEDVKVPKLNLLLEKFKRKAFSNFINAPSNEIQWLIIAQHYGLATKLLDWTTNALIGLYFSLPDQKTLDDMYNINFEEMIEVIVENNLKLEEIKNISKKELYDLKYWSQQDIYNLSTKELNYNMDVKNAASVYIMSPNILNKCTTSLDSPIYVGGKDIEDDIKYFINANSKNNNILLKSISNSTTNEFPICIVCNEFDKRIISQSGCFTLHGYYCAPLDFYEVFKDNIHKIYIPYNSIELIRDELKQCGINKYFVYQDLNSLSEEINNEELKIFSNI